MAQYARPTSDEQIDTASGGNQWWSGNGVSQTDLYQQIDEVTLDESDFIRHKSVGTETARWYKTGLGTISKPSDMSTVSASVTSKRTSSGYSVTVYLTYGSTTIKFWSMPADSTATTNVTTLSEAEAEDIQSAAETAGHSDWEDLQLWFLADDDNSFKTGFVYQAFVEAGDAAEDAPSASHSVTAVADRVKETTTTVGTGTVSLAGPASGFTGFSDVLSDTNTTYYTIISGNDTDWETGVGTFSSSGDTLARTTVLSNSAGTTAKISLTGTSTVFCSYPAAEAIHGIGSGGRMVQTSSQTLTDGSYDVITFDTTSAPGFSVGSAVEMDTSNDKIILKKKGLYFLSGHVYAEDASASSYPVMWLGIGTGTGIGDAFVMNQVEATNYEYIYNDISALYYVATPNQDIYLGAYVVGDGSSGLETDPSSSRRKCSFSASYIR